MSLIDNETFSSSSLMNKLNDFGIIIKKIVFSHFNRPNNKPPLVLYTSVSYKQTDHLRESLKHENNANKLIR
jgi:hypothetical protein